MSKKLIIGSAVVGGVLLLLGRSRATAARPSSYAAIYKQRCPRIPSEYLEALAKKESDNNPNEQDGPAWGLLQVVESVRREYNDHHGTSYARNDLLNPEVNVTIACWLLDRIASIWARRYPRAFPRGVEWSSRRAVELYTAGWNAGWSDASGVGYVIGEMIDRGYAASQITIDKVFEIAPQLPKSHATLTNDRAPLRLSWAKSVVALYLRNLRGAAS